MQFQQTNFGCAACKPDVQPRYAGHDQHAQQAHDWLPLSKQTPGGLSVERTTNSTGQDQQVTTDQDHDRCTTWQHDPGRLTQRRNGTEAKPEVSDQAAPF